VVSEERATSRVRGAEERIRELAVRRAQLRTRPGRASTPEDAEAAAVALTEALHHAAQAREILRESLNRSAAAHERAADARAQAAARGGSGAAVHRAAAARHRADAQADRRRAAEL
jgi:hypothetical protein